MRRCCAAACLRGHNRIDAITNWCSAVGMFLRLSLVCVSVSTVLGVLPPPDDFFACAMSVQTVAGVAMQTSDRVGRGAEAPVPGPQRYALCQRRRGEQVDVDQSDAQPD